MRGWIVVRSVAPLWHIQLTLWQGHPKALAPHPPSLSVPPSQVFFAFASPTSHCHKSLTAHSVQWQKEAAKQTPTFLSLSSLFCSLHSTSRHNNHNTSSPSPVFHEWIKNDIFSSTFIDNTHSQRPRWYFLPCRSAGRLYPPRTSRFVPATKAAKKQLCKDRICQQPRWHHIVKRCIVPPESADGSLSPGGHEAWEHRPERGSPQIRSQQKSPKKQLCKNRNCQQSMIGLRRSWDQSVAATGQGITSCRQKAALQGPQLSTNHDGVASPREDSQH